MHFTLCFKVSGVSGFFGLEGANMITMAIEHNPGNVTVPELECSLQSRATIAARFVYILLVQGSRAITNIAKSIVRFFAIYVINFQWPFSGHIKPRKPMCRISFLIDIYHTVFIAGSAGCSAGSASVGQCFKPSERSRRWIVVEYYFEAFLSKLGFSHFRTSNALVVRSLISVSALIGLRHYSPIGAK
jgi:hypothetical protein